MPRDIGRFSLEITKAIRTEAGLEIGGTVRVVVERDMEERAVEVPDGLSSALRSHGLDGRFTSLTPSHRREYVRWITAAKRDATRANRVAKAVAMIGEGRDPP